MQSKEEVSLESKLTNHTNQSVRTSNLNTYRFSFRQDRIQIREQGKNVLRNTP